MPTARSISVKSLHLDLNNFRIRPQKSESDEILMLHKSEPSWFEGLLLSMANEGYNSLELIGVLKAGGKFTVLEGNRRVAVLKILHGYADYKKLGIKMSSNAVRAICDIDDNWKQGNKKIPCMVYAENEIEDLRRIVRRIHGLDDLARRKPWDSISKARENRSRHPEEEPELNILEYLIENDPKITEDERSRWMSSFKFTLFEEVIRKVCQLSGIGPNILNRELRSEDLPHDFIDTIYDLFRGIGRDKIAFKDIRDNSEKFYRELALPPIPDRVKNLAVLLPTSEGETSVPEQDGRTSRLSNDEPNAQVVMPTEKSRNESSPSPAPNKRQTYKKDDLEKEDKRGLKSLDFSGYTKYRLKLSTLVNEITELSFKKVPNAVVLLVRSIIDLMASEFVDTHIPDRNKERLKDKINEIVKFCEQRFEDKATRINFQQSVHVGQSTLTDDKSLFSITYMNCITHQGNSHAECGTVCTGIQNILPLMRHIAETMKALSS